MEKKLENLANEDKQAVDEYLQFMKQEISQGNYFKDAIDWYILRYVSPICDRTILFIGALISCIVCYIVVGIIKMSFPLVIRDPIIIKAKDQAKYIPKLIPLKPKSSMENFDPDIKNIDEAIAKYLIKSYTIDREEFNFSKAMIEDINIKFARIKNNSSSSEFRNFQNFYSEENPQSPIQNFGKNVYKTIEIVDIRFIRESSKNYRQQILDYFSVQIPKKAEIRFNSKINYTDENGEKKFISEKYLSRVSFSLKPVNKIKEEKEKKINPEDKKIKFIVESYQLFRIKN
ncbi:hypothetical protein LBMAG18_10070 [Alphaproteobacteria bacterium]|nr:hypothetical protein LBMAG18_10070 [Alphaproteobacteria bacterium]